MEAQPVVVSLQKKGIMFEIHLDEQEEEDIKKELKVQKKEDVKLVEAEEVEHRVQTGTDKEKNGNAQEEEKLKRQKCKKVLKDRKRLCWSETR